MVPDFVNLRGVLGGGWAGHAQELLEHSDCFHGRVLWILASGGLAKRFSVVLPIHIHSARGHYWRLFLLHSDRRAGRITPPVGDTAPTECLCQWLTTATTTASLYGEVGTDTAGKAALFSFL